MATHCYQGVRSRNSVPLVDGAVPRKFPRDEKEMDVRLCNPGVDWAEISALTEKYTQKFDDSLDEYLTKCFAKTNLRLSRSSVSGRPQQFILSSFTTPHLSNYQKKNSRATRKRPKLAIIISDEEDDLFPQAQPAPVKQQFDQPNSPVSVKQQFDQPNSPVSVKQQVDQPNSPVSVKQQVDQPNSPVSVKQQIDQPLLESSPSPVKQQEVDQPLPSSTALVKQQVDQPLPNSPALVEEQVDYQPRPALVDQPLHNSPAPVEQQVDQPLHNSPALVEQQVDQPLPNSPAPVEQQVDQPSPNSPAPVEQQVDQPLLNSPAPVEQQVDQPSPNSPALVKHKVFVQPLPPIEDEAATSSTQNEDSDSFHTPMVSSSDPPQTSSEEEDEAAQNDKEGRKVAKLRLQRLELFNTKGSENKAKHQPLVKVAKSFLPRNSPRRPETHEEKNKQLQEKIAKKKADEELRQKELALRKEQERLERIKKREEKMKRVQEKQAQLQKEAEEQKKEKIVGQRTKQQQLKEKLLQEQQKKKEERNQKQRERMLAAESRRKQEEEYKKQKILKAEEERKMIEEVLRKRMEAEDERKKVDAADREKQRLREREEREAIEREKEAEIKKKKEQQMQKEHQPKKVMPTESVDKMLQHWKQQLDQRKAAKDATISRLPPIFPSSSSAKPALDTTFTKPEPSTATVSTPQPNKCHQKYAGIDSYELTPANPLDEADSNYNISDLSSDDSTDDESCPKKKVPKWAASGAVNRVMSDQESRVQRHPEIPDHIFTPEELLVAPDLSNMFKKKRKRFFVRSSSAHWTSPLIKRSRPTTS